MPTVFLFIILATLLAIVLAIIVLIPWLTVDKSAQSNQLIVLNVDVFQQRLKELQEDYQADNISETAFKNQKTELERQLLQASEDSRQATVQPSAKRSTKPSANAPNDNPSDPKHMSDVDSVIDADSISDADSIRDINSTLRFTQSKKSRVTILVCVPLLMGLGYAMAADRTPVVKLWNAKDTLSQVADDLLTGKIDVPPEWATTDNAALLGAIQTNVHEHAYDPERWMRLADIYLAFEANEQALEAMARAYRLAPTDEAIAVRYAQTQFFTSNGMLNQDSYDILRNVLQANPAHQGAQMLMAMGETSAGNYDQAQAWVDKLRVGISQRPGDNSAALQSLDKMSQNIAQRKAQTLQAGDTADKNSLSSDFNNTSTNSNDVVISVSLNTSLLPLLEPTDTLFVTVKEETGGPPLAAKRLSVDEMLKTEGRGLTIQLNDNDAMMPTRTISAAMSDSKSLVVTARISKTGQAITASGDLAADAMPLSYDEKGVTPVNIEINQQVP